MLACYEKLKLIIQGGFIPLVKDSLNTFLFERDASSNLIDIEPTNEEIVRFNTSRF